MLCLSFPKTECPLSLIGSIVLLDLILNSGFSKCYLGVRPCKKKFVSFVLFIAKNVGTYIAGAGFGSKSKYMFGKVTVQLKLVEGDSAGTVTAFYVSENLPFAFFNSLVVLFFAMFIRRLYWSIWR